MFSFKDRLRLENGDTMIVAFKGFGRPLRNPLKIEGGQQSAVVVKAL
jgi:hypothetical protein